MDKHKLAFGVFNSGKVVFILNIIECSHVTAMIIVGILDLANGSLRDGDYFACDYTQNLWEQLNGGN